MLPPMPTVPAGPPPPTSPPEGEPPASTEPPAAQVPGPTPAADSPEETVEPAESSTSEQAGTPDDAAAPQEAAAPEEPVAPEADIVEPQPPGPEEVLTAEEPPVADLPVAEPPAAEPATVEPVAVEPVAVEPVAVEPVAVEPAKPRTAPRAAVLSLLVLAVVVSVLLALVTVRLSNRQGANSGQAHVTSTASSAVATVLSYDYRHLAADFAAAERLLTPNFRKQYDATTAKGVQPLASKYKAVSTASVSAAGIVSLSGSRAVVLVFVQQTVTNTQLSAPRLDRSRVDVSLVKSGNRWLIDKLTPL
jgi:Mce-associated membrane protein